MISRIPTTHTHIAESPCRATACGGDHVGAIMDRSDGRAASRIARSGRIIGAGGSGSGTSHPVVAGRLARAAGWRRRLPLARTRGGFAVDLRPRGSGGSARPQGTRPGAGQGAGCSVGDRGSAGAGRMGSAELDLAAPGRRDREANRRAHLEIAAQRGAEKGGFAWRRPRHTLKGRQDADAVDRSGLRLRLLKQQAEAGDITLLFGDESEALTHPYLARAWAKRGCDLRVEAPGQSKKRAMIGALDCAAPKLIVNTSAPKRSK